LIGLLVDCLLISPFVVPTNEVPVLDFFCIWFLGTHLLKFWTKLVSCNFLLVAFRTLQLGTVRKAKLFGGRYLCDTGCKAPLHKCLLLLLVLI
jgi:hypothetical protein